MSIVPSDLREDAPRSFWDCFTEKLLGQVVRAHFETWLSRLACLNHADGAIELVAPSPFTRDWIGRHYAAALAAAAEQVDSSVHEVRILHAAELPPARYAALETLGRIRLRTLGAAHSMTDGSGSEAATPVVRLSETTAAAETEAADAAERFNTSSLEFFERHSDFVLNESFTFEQFVTGSCNELACASSRAVAEFPGGPYNPLFIHGSSGLGKTHLLQAVCNSVLRSDTPRRILYLSCESFVNQFIQAITNGDLEAFRYKYRKVDMLLLDDIQFLEGKTRTQEEFFHTFNTIYNAQRQIVLSSDRPPSAIATLQDRLISRFRWGMVTKIDKPCLETRVAILQRKARLRGIELRSDVAQTLAEYIDTNIRELEGAVTKVLAYAKLVGREIDVDCVQEALEDLLPARPQVMIQEVIDLVSREYGVQPKELQSKRRMKSVVLPRQVGIYLARRHTQMSLEEIGGFFGGRDHSTVLHSVKKIVRLIGDDRELAQRISRLSEQLERS